MHRLLYLALWLFLGATFLVSSTPTDSQASALTYTVPQIAVSVTAATVEPGATQRLDIRIDELPDRRTSLILVVTYPSGEVSRSLHYIDGGVGSVEWSIPAAAGVGEATFRLIADGCACGEKNTIPRQAAVDGTVEGRFVVGGLQ